MPPPDPENKGYPAPHSGSPQPRRPALIAGEEESGRLALKSHLKTLGYEVVEAIDGQQAIEHFTRHQPDIVFMDLPLPVTDGYQAISRIKQLAGDQFIPIICLVAPSDEKVLARCLASGGDDFLPKPISFSLLSAKLAGMERIRDLEQTNRRFVARIRQDEKIAEQLLQSAVVAGNVALEQIHTLLKPAEHFSGDLLLTAFAPSRDLHLLLGDFTGHGLAAALGALPTSEVFRSMTAKGFAPQQILYAINNKLNALLPTGMFLAVAYLKIDSQLNHLTIINCGMPDVFLVDRSQSRIKQRFASQTLPLGIEAEISYQDVAVNVPIETGDRLILASDGVTEARNRDGEFFGEQRLIDTLTKYHEEDFLIERLAEILETFCDKTPQDDDISAIEVPLTPDLLPSPETGESVPQNEVEHWEGLLSRGHGDSVEFTLTLRGNQLRLTDPIPILLNYIQETAALHEHRRPLFTILTELYVNALDHGILQLASSLKQEEDGFTTYFQQREQRLQSLTEGEIRIGLRIHNLPGSGYIVIRVEDSGRGFDIAGEMAQEVPASQFNGRGIMLVRALCKRLRYTAPGNKAEAIYVWGDMGGE